MIGKTNREANGMGYTNLHTHTNFSDGKHSHRENVLSAIEKGMEALGFSDHSFTPCDTSYCMQQEAYAGYLAVIRELKEEFSHRVRIYAGLELYYYSQIPEGDFDYLIASVHYIVENGVCYPIDHSAQQQRQCADEMFGGDMLALAERYYAQLAEHVNWVRPAVVGHFDVITKFGLMPEADPAYRRLAQEALEKIIPVCPVLEMNTGAIARGLRHTPYPADYLLDTVRQLGGQITLGSDSHHKDNLVFYFDEAVERLRSAGFDSIAVFNGCGFDSRRI